MGFDERKIIAVCTSWEDVENLNLVLNRLIEATEKAGFLPLNPAGRKASGSSCIPSKCRDWPVFCCWAK